MEYTDEEIQTARLSNNIPPNYVAIRTSSGAVVFINPINAAIIQRYTSGELTGNEPVPAGVSLRLSPKPEPTVEPAPLVTPRVPPLVTPRVPPPVTPRTKLPAVIRKFEVPILVEIIATPQPIRTSIRIDVEVSPPETPSQTKTVEYNFNLDRLPITINLSEPIIATANQFLSDIIDVYIDEERELKTLLNYGEDRQSVALAYRRGPLGVDGIDTIQLKLLQPVPADVAPNTPVFLSRESAKSIIDKVRVRFTPPIDATPYLRPKNLKVKADLDTGKNIRNVTLNKLSLQSGSIGKLDQFSNKTFEDEIFRQWYSYDFNSSELNIDFTNYENFIFYSSAAMRLKAFRQKLSKIDSLSELQKQLQASYTANTASAGFIYIQDKSAEYSLEKENIIRSFDRYEQYLFFTPSGSNSSYSASFAYADTGTEYNLLGYWPKSGSELWPINSEPARDWYETQLDIAQRFDEFNENNLINTIPTYVREDHASDAYLTFVSMVAQMFDNIKLYIDQVPNIYSRNLNPNEELSKDLINEIAESMGFVLPTIDSVFNLTDNILGTTDTVPRRELAAEIYKRLLHNLPFFAKAKGTKTALQVFLNTLGITPQLLSIRETGTPATSSYSVFDEYSTGLSFDSTKNSFVRLPIAASNRAPTTLQFNFTIAKNSSMTLLTGDDKWALNVIPHPTISTLGKLELTSGSANDVILSSSYYNIFGDELLNAALQTYNNTSSLHLIQVNGDDLLFNDATTDSTSFPLLWATTDYVFVGGAGARVINRYEGTIDEVRLWGTPLSEETLVNTAFDPGSNAGDIYSDAANYLYAQLAFNNITSSSLGINNITNESPYKDKLAVPPIDTLFAFNISGSDFVRYNRTIKQLTPVAGTSTSVTNKITVAPEPIFQNNSSGLRLYRNKSIAPIEQKRLNRGRNKIILAVSPTDVVNQNIIRNLGLENINAVLGAPSTLYTTFDKSLASLKGHYQQYHYVDVNTNKFIRILSDLSSVLTQIVDYFIPSKATLLKGVVIEPNILEQVKIPPVRNIRVYGKDARKTINAPNSLTGSLADYEATFNLEKTIVNSKATASAEYMVYDGGTGDMQFVEVLSNYSTITSGSAANVADVTDMHAAYITQTGHISEELFTPYANLDEFTTVVEQPPAVVLSDMNMVSSSVNMPAPVVNSSIPTIVSESIVQIIPSSISENSSYETYKNQHQNINYSGPDQDSRINIGVTDVNKIPYNAVNNGSEGAEPYNRIYSRKLFNEEISTNRLGGNTSLYVHGLYDIPPAADFNDFGVYTYFNNDTGIYYFNEIKKQPAYSADLNATWNFNNQSFGTTATTWSYGQGYNKYDVVYQDVSQEMLTADNLNSTLAVLGGNKRYYVFKTTPSYATATTNTATYSGSIPSFTPPSLDKKNWDLLRFKPVQVRVPKRVVFDTYTISDPALNNFKTTTISADTVINIPDRYIDTFNIGTIQNTERITGELTVQNIAVLFAIQSSTVGLRIRLYRTELARDADLTRSFETKPTGAHGVLLDAEITSENTVEIANPIHTLVAGENPPVGKIFYTIDNLNNFTKLGVTLQLYYFAIEIEARVPLGYLRKHYKFFRDNSTATKRRNYIGCVNTISTTVDGLPPIQIFIGEGTDLQVSPASLNNEIVTGGGGTLNVT
jgi:hypothetical protein